MGGPDFLLGSDYCTLLLAHFVLAFISTFVLQPFPHLIVFRLFSFQLTRGDLDIPLPVYTSFSKNLSLNPKISLSTEETRY